VSSRQRSIARLVLGAFLLYTGVSHLSFARTDFHAQVPPWLPLNADVVIIASGVMEIALGASLVLLTRWRVPVVRHSAYIVFAAVVTVACVLALPDRSRVDIDDAAVYRR
jgi:uncharacterized membrane protein